MRWRPLLSFVCNGVYQWSVPAGRCWGVGGGSEDGREERSSKLDSERDEIRIPWLFGSLLRATDLASAGKMETTNKTYLQPPQFTAVEVPIDVPCGRGRTGSGPLKISHDGSRFDGPLLEN